MDDYIRSQDGTVGAEVSDGHFDLAGLAAYARGEIEGEEGEAVLRHCRSCPSCGDHLAMILLLVEIKELRAARSRRTIVAVAASAILALLVGAALWSGALRLPPGRTDAADLGRRMATAEAPNRVDLDFIYPVSAVGGLGTTEKRAELEMLVNGDYAAAVARLSELNRSSPGDAEVAALLGIGLYLTGDNGQLGERLLQQGTELRRQDLQRYAAWYLANLYLRRGDLGRATEALKDLSTEADAPGAMATSILDRLGEEPR
jgi:hypothetical protein